jgi:hypothetical protein
MFSLALLLWLTLPVLWLLAWTGVWKFTVGWSTGRPTILALVVEERGAIVAQYLPSAWGDYSKGPWETTNFPGGSSTVYPLASGRTAWVAQLRIWTVQAVLTPLPIAAYFYRRGAKQHVHRVRHGHCLQCGYDLRSSGDQCPECGTRRDARQGAASAVGDDATSAP